MTALYVKIDNEIGGMRWTGRPCLLSDSELICLAVANCKIGAPVTRSLIAFDH
ncbi:hypothetical protein ABT072_24830 [Streptomyces sp. NPDC002589]|uniref:hypothetical protein n=1 Tax=Streptomyces sp. NPDC002589 TaxID=3154420 RepID=UPI0033241F1D